MEEIKLDEAQKDALKEVANIGASHAATALSKMINKDIDIDVPKIEITPLSETINCVKDEKIGVGIYLQITDTLPSYVLLIMPKESAFALAGLLTGENDETKNILSEMDQSALKEVANIIMCAFFDSITALIDVPLVPSPPALAYDEPVAVMDYVLIQIGEVADTAVVFNANLEVEKTQKININMLLLPEPKSVKVLLEKLGIACGESIKDEV